MVELTFAWKAGIFFVILVMGYFALRYYELDPFVALWESVSELEWNMTALILTLIFSAILWAIIWKNPFWVNSIAYGTTSKIILTIALPIVSYPLAVRALNK